MSSISGAQSHTRFEPISIDYNSNGQYLVDGKPASEADVNKALAPRGIAASRGTFTTTDGIELNSTNSNAVTLNGTAPLPDVSGQTAGYSVMGDKLSWMNEISEGALMWAALSTMAQTSMLDMKTSKELKNALEQQKIEAKTSQINATEKRIEAERKAAMEQLIVSCCVAIATFAISALTAGSSNAVSSGSSQGAQAGTQTSAALYQSASAIGQVVGAAGQYYIKTQGAQAEADRKQVEEARWAREEAIIDQSIETAKGNYEEARELFKQALKIMTEHVERNTQVVQKITS